MTKILTQKKTRGANMASDNHEERRDAILSNLRLRIWFSYSICCCFLRRLTSADERIVGLLFCKNLEIFLSLNFQ